MIESYQCCAPVHTLHTGSGSGKAFQCQGKMRLTDVPIESIPFDGANVITKLFVCDKCGRTALPEPEPAE